MRRTIELDQAGGFTPIPVFHLECRLLALFGPDRSRSRSLFIQAMRKSRRRVSNQPMPGCMAMKLTLAPPNWARSLAFFGGHVLRQIEVWCDPNHSGLERR
jgi:hypothetical protein